MILLIYLLLCSLVQYKGFSYQSHVSISSSSRLYISTDVVVDDEVNQYDRQRYACRVMYDGTAFRGWQAQEPKIRTVQGVIGKKLSERFNIPMRITGAGRTDNGVHARGQAGHFDIPHEISNKIDPLQLEFVLNRLLPDDIRLYNVSNMKDIEFHATASAKSKLYVYRICTNQVVDPLRRRYYTHVYHPNFNLQLFEDTLQYFVGTYNFKAFANRVEHTNKGLNKYGYGQLDTMRTVNSINFINEGDGYYFVEFRVRSALYRMIRNIVGASIGVATEQLTIERLTELLYNGENYSRVELKTKSAPSEGLTLEMVYYNVF